MQSFFDFRCSSFPTPVRFKDADLIRDEREGKFIYYELNASVLEEIILWISELKGEDDYDQTT